MQITGSIIAVLQERSGISQKGNKWKSITYVLQTHEQFSKKIAFDIFNEKIDEYKIQQGEFINVSFDINAHEYNGRWFNQINVWDVTKAQSPYINQQQAHQTMQTSNIPSIPEASPSQDDNLPF